MNTLRKYLSRLPQKSGQTAVEYLILLLVVITMVLGIGRRIRALTFGNGDCPNESLVCRVLDTFQAPGYLEGSYRYFTLRR